MKCKEVGIHRKVWGVLNIIMLATGLYHPEGGYVGVIECGREEEGRNDIGNVNSVSTRDVLLDTKKLPPRPQSHQHHQDNPHPHQIVEVINWAHYCKMNMVCCFIPSSLHSVSYTHLRAHETPEHLVCRLLLEKKKKKN
eukprot:TRINITY_DN5181_c0_g3_i2.p1 TRINITY_DN5181_c0_g3~~TRINITY_DN5181_c0_g3_i2.p1  ORF type:complete len:139 (+),score=15.32 TRINITY_DN5181_c0_g3_i2:209-625(+)